MYHYKGVTNVFDIPTYTMYSLKIDKLKKLNINSNFKITVVIFINHCNINETQLNLISTE